ncbi:MAG TPA: HAD-IIIA family hydrolase [Steroidobacteraceae bacterium]|nr:HAD-IIIA family hydrolase [Steroidobacteraceae bacterium]HRX88318.1 HAD-IIIA family hydrolase [Steroidobacteraceae bacterium]
MPAVPRGLRARANKIRLLVLDVDGVLTDGRLYYGSRGESLKVFHVQDGHGIKQLQRAGIAVAIVSGRRSAGVTRRARELGIKAVHQGVTDKLALVARLAKDRRFNLAQCGCVGDDSPDVPVMRAVGLAVAVANAHADALSAAHYITTCRGGDGAVREVCDLLLALRATTP